MNIILSSVIKIRMGRPAQARHQEFIHPDSACPLYGTDSSGNITDQLVSDVSMLMDKSAFIPDVTDDDVFMFLLSGFDVKVIEPQFVKIQDGKYGLLRSKELCYIPYKRLIKRKSHV